MAVDNSHTPLPNVLVTDEALLLVAECSCHIYIVLADGRPSGRCGRCGERVKVRGAATPQAKTVCKHEGNC